MATAIAQMKALVGQPGFGRAQLVQVRTVVEGLAARREFWAIPYGDYFIWGATAGMIVNLSDVLLAP